MQLTFIKLSGNRLSPKPNTVYLQSSNWDDYSFKTTFYAILYDEHRQEHSLGQLKIGYVQQEHGWTAHYLDEVFPALKEGFFSLGQSVEYYRDLQALPQALREAYLSAMRDVVFDEQLLAAAKDQRVFKDSLLRGINFSTISNQFHRVLIGGHVLTDFRFRFATEETKDRAAFDLKFNVSPDLKPSTNIHVLIGRNGTGKTTLLNSMICALTEETTIDGVKGTFFDTSGPKARPISEGYFSGVVSVSFSAFDPFTPPLDRDGDVEEIRYSYVGLKRVFEDENGRQSKHKDMQDLSKDFVDSLITCFGIEVKRARWAKAISFLESDLNFSEMDLGRLLKTESQEKLRTRAKNTFRKMSSGHAIVLLTITKLVERAEEKTLILMDEPESHLHPPLLSAFTRALADLLNTINGIAIIATHSPVVLQEVPKNCVWKLFRTKLVGSADRPEMETFAENVGILTREVFSLEVSRSGFHDLLARSVEEGKSYESVLEEYNDRIGYEGRALVRGLILQRDKERSSNERGG